MLTKRAFLNATAGFLGYGSKILVGLVITPFLVSSLGGSLFGVWQMLLRLGEPLSSFDGKSTEAL